MTKTLDNSDVSGARQNVPDIKVFGDGDMFKIIDYLLQQSNPLGDLTTGEGGPAEVE